MCECASVCVCVCACVSRPHNGNCINSVCRPSNSDAVPIRPRFRPIHVA